MDQVWPWITTLPAPSDWPSSAPSLPLAATTASHPSILLTASRTAGSDTDPLLTFSLSLHGFHSNSPHTLWLSNPFPPSSLHLLLLTQLLQEVISFSPSPGSTVTLNPNLLSSALSATDAPEFLSLALLCRLFWLCAFDAPADAGFLFFHTLDPSLLSHALACRTAASSFFRAAGPDIEEWFARSLGYVLSKWCILRELQLGPTGRPVPTGCCSSYVADSHGLWVLRGYAPIPAMALTASGGAGSPAWLEPKEAVLRYALAHQQLEAVVQLEHTVCFKDPRFIRITVRVDNIRLHVARLGIAGGSSPDEEREEEEGSGYEFEGERHFPSKVRIWVGPEVGSGYATGPSLGRSTANPEREVEASRTFKGNFGGGGKAAGVKAKARTSARTRGRSWRWEQEAEGSAAAFDGVLYDGATGVEVAGWRPPKKGGGGKGGDPRGGMRRRLGGVGRAFGRSGGVVVAGDEVPEGVSWRVGREMEGRAVRWRVGGRFWVSYFPNEVRSGYFETRWVEWKEEVELALVAAG